jgi:hypothetical protein
VCDEMYEEDMRYRKLRKRINTYSMPEYHR